MPHALMGEPDSPYGIASRTPMHPYSVGFTVGVAVTLSRRPELISYGRLHTLFFVSCAGLAALSLVLSSATAALLESPGGRA